MCGCVIYTTKGHTFISECCCVPCCGCFVSKWPRLCRMNGCDVYEPVPGGCVDMCTCAGCPCLLQVCHCLNPSRISRHTFTRRQSLPRCAHPPQKGQPLSSTFPEQSSTTLSRAPSLGWLCSFSACSHIKRIHSPECGAEGVTCASAPVPTPPVPPRPAPGPTPQRSWAPPHSRPTSPAC